MTRTEWKAHFARSSGPATSSFVTSSGRVKDRKKVERGKRYLKNISPITQTQEVEHHPATALTSGQNPERGPMPSPGTQSQGVQHSVIPQPSCPGILDDELFALGRANSIDWQFTDISLHLSDVLNPFRSNSLDLPTSGLAPTSTNTSTSARNTMRHLVLSTHESSFNINSECEMTTNQRQPDDWTFSLGDFASLNVDGPDIEDLLHSLAPDCSLLAGQTSPAHTGALCNSSSSNKGIGQLASRALPLGLRKDWLRTLPFAKFEAFLSARGVFLTPKTDNNSRSSISGVFAFIRAVNMLYNSDGTMSRRIDRVHTSFRILGALAPSTAGAVISEQQMTETSIIRMLLYSMMNGFAGLNDIPIDRLLPCLRRLDFFDTSFLQLLQGAPSHSWRTFVDNVSKAAVEAKDETIVQLLLRRGVVDVNNTVFFTRGRRCTPVERAASLSACNMIRILISYGADVEKTYVDIDRDNWKDVGACRGALWWLLEAIGSLRNSFEGYLRGFDSLTRAETHTTVTDGERK